MQTPKDMWRPLDNQEIEEERIITTLVEKREDVEVYTTEGPDSDIN